MPLHWVLVQADYGLSTPAVYAQLDRLRAAAGSDTLGSIGAVPAAAGAQAEAEPAQVDPVVLQALRAGDAEALAGVLVNDLQPASVALAPQLLDVLDGGRPARCAGLPGLRVRADGGDAGRATRIRRGPWPNGCRPRAATPSLSTDLCTAARSSPTSCTNGVR